MNQVEYDIIGVGFGPSNISLAITLEEESPNRKVLFFEKELSCEWQAGLLLTNSDIQNHPLRDLATPRNPKSHYSFTNYLFENNRLFEHLNLGLYFPYRYEYRDYIKWAAGHFDGIVQYSTSIISIKIINSYDGENSIIEIQTNGGKIYRCKNLVIGTGRTPYIPVHLQQLGKNHLIHGAEFNKIIGDISSGKIKSIAVVGGSQSAIEIMIFLADKFPHLEIHGVSRKFGYRLKDTSPFTGEVYFPEFVDTFFNSKEKHKARLKNDLNLTNYSASDGDVLNELYRTIYRDKYFSHHKIRIHNSADIIESGVKDSVVTLQIMKNHGSEETYQIDVDMVVSATGFKDIGMEEYQEICPPLLSELYPLMSKNSHNGIVISRDYKIDFINSTDIGIYLNGLCESSHGLGDAGSLSLVSIRSKHIIDSIEKNIKNSKIYS
ncbi:SidA/IucD/PvdA family monooxygenase [Photorhabdus temperata]|uniref:SidA/IucD/PvdA family monooxygenase n=1 Tax=Photorhabdus temperata TaxID=574560 RepID=UPI00038A51CC|nr:SidA/IucD/PvdA family monooxygenase [Photorhabdus temperata]EQC00152.1 hypothetical protein B738_12839 [Photorhabdus temperata subsp. temperata M1021]